MFQKTVGEVRNKAHRLGLKTNRSNIYSRGSIGTRPDLGIFVRSAWEANYARYLNWLVAQARIQRWEYEPETFWFEAIRRGVRSYKPDFKVYLLNGGHEWHEVKGWMDPKSATKLKRMKKYHPAETVVLIGQAWFHEAERSGLSGVLPNWERAKAPRQIYRDGIATQVRRSGR